MSRAWQRGSCGGEADAFRDVPSPQARDRAAGIRSCGFPLGERRNCPTGVLHIVYPSLIADPRRPGTLIAPPVCFRHVSHRSRPRIVFVAALIALATLTALAGAPSATAASSLSCAEKIVDDWYGDGRVDKIFPIPCYKAAIRSLPVDVLDYSRAEEDILRALQYARNGDPDPARPVGRSRTATTLTRPALPRARPTPRTRRTRPPTMSTHPAPLPSRSRFSSWEDSRCSSSQRAASAT